MGFLTRSSHLFSKHLLSVCHQVRPRKCRMNKTWLMSSRTSEISRGTDTHVCVNNCKSMKKWNRGVERGVWTTGGRGDLICPGHESFHPGSDIYTGQWRKIFTLGSEGRGKFGRLISRKSLPSSGQSETENEWHVWALWGGVGGRRSCECCTKAFGFYLKGARASA